MCIHIYVCMYVCIYIHTQIRRFQVNLNFDFSDPNDVYLGAQINPICIYIYTYICIYISKCLMCVCVYTYIHIYIHI